MDLMNIDQNDLDQLTQMFIFDSHPPREEEQKIEAEVENSNLTKATENTAAKNKGRKSKKRKSNLITNYEIEPVEAKTEDIPVEEIKDKLSKVNKRQKKPKDNNNNPQIEVTEVKKGKRGEKLAEKETGMKSEHKQPKESLEDDSQEKTIIAEANDKKKKKGKKEEIVSKIKKGREKEKDQDQEVSVKKYELEEGDPKRTVLEYMIGQNRPYSLINIFDNLHAKIKKAPLQKILDSLSESGDLICKEYAGKVYLASQKHYPKIDQTLIIKLDDDIESTKATLNTLKDISSSDTTELKQVLTKYSDKDLALQSEIREAVLAKIKSDLIKWQEGKIEKIPEEKMAEAEKTYNINKNSLKKTKKICIDIVDTFCEGMEMKRVELMNLFGFETETDILLRLPYP